MQFLRLTLKKTRRIPSMNYKEQNFNSPKAVYIDFEFRDSNEKNPTLICCSLMQAGEMERYWLFDGRDAQKLKDRITTLNNCIFFAYVVSAEARCFLSLGFNPLDFKWVDLYYEFKQAQYGDNRYKYGWCYRTKNGFTDKVLTSPTFETKDGVKVHKKMYDRQGIELEVEGGEVPASLVNALLSTCNIDLDPVNKKDMRDLILGAVEFDEKDETLIQEYCDSDVEHLPTLAAKLYRIVSEKCWVASGGQDQNILSIMRNRGRYGAALAIVESNGYPIDMELLENLHKNAPIFYNHIKKPIDKMIPGYLKHNLKRSGSIQYTEKKDILTQWIDDNDITVWPRTKKSGAYTTSLDELQPFVGDPRINTFVNFLWEKKFLNKISNYTTLHNLKQKTGKDGMTRILQGGFGALSSRNACRANDYVYLWPKFTRAIVRHPHKTMVSLDYKSQEFLVAAVLSNDENMLNAYGKKHENKDVYLEFAKASGLVPPEGTREEYGYERDLCKQFVLGIQFGMGLEKLQGSLTAALAEEVPMGKVKFLKDTHRKTYKNYWAMVDSVKRRYGRETSPWKDRTGCRPPQLTDGWVLGPNERVTTAQNFKVQGNAARIMRDVVYGFTKAELPICALLHDGFYFWCEPENADKVESEARDIMQKAFKEALETDQDIKIDSYQVKAGDVYCEDMETFNKYKDYIMRDLTKDKKHVVH